MDTFQKQAKQASKNLQVTIFRHFLHYLPFSAKSWSVRISICRPAARFRRSATRRQKSTEVSMSESLVHAWRMAMEKSLRNTANSEDWRGNNEIEGFYMFLYSIKWLYVGSCKVLQKNLSILNWPSIKHGFPHFKIPGRVCWVPKTAPRPKVRKAPDLNDWLQESVIDGFITFNL